MNQPNFTAQALGGATTTLNLSTLTNFLSQHDVDVATRRIRRYQRNWSIYSNQSWHLSHEAARNPDGEHKTKSNFSALSVEKNADWLFGQPWKIKTPAGNENLAGLLEYIWNANDGLEKCWRAAHHGGVTGDCYMRVDLDDYDFIRDKPRDPKDVGILIQVLDPMYVHPTFDPHSNEIIRAIIHYPVVVDAKFTKYGIESGSIKMYTCDMQPDMIREYIDGIEMTDRARENTFGAIPIAYWPNRINAHSFHGTADIDVIADIEAEMNALIDSMADVVYYHAEPITIMYGYRATNLERGANRIWSGLPIEAKVENLKLEGDQTATQQLVDNYVTFMHQRAQIPKQAVADVQSLTNVSEASLRVQYMPLVELWQRKKISYGNGLRRVNKLIVQHIEKYFDIDLVSVLELQQPHRRYETTIEFGSPFPRDTSLHLQDLEAMKRNGVISEAEALRTMNYDNPQKIAMEITADKRAALLSDVERAQATAGNAPNLNALNMGSIPISFNLMEFFFELDEKALMSLLVAREYRDTLKAINQEELTRQQLEQAKEQKEQADAVQKKAEESDND